MTLPRSNLFTVDGNIVLLDVSTPKFPDAVPIIDKDDLALVLNGGGRWCAFSNGNNTLYAHRTRRLMGRMKTTLLHRHILGIGDTSSPLVDHRDGNGLNNSRLNLRHADKSKNAANSRHRRAGQQRGVYSIPLKDGTPRWLSYITANGSFTYLGTFYCEQAAADAYDTAVIAAFGEFSNPNKGKIHR